MDNSNDLLSSSGRGDAPSALAYNPDSRRFALGDAMVLIAMVALLCAIWPSVAFLRLFKYIHHAPEAMRYLYFDGPSPDFAPNGSAMVIREYLWLTPLTIFREVGVPVLIAATPAVLLMRLRKPRPDWRHLFRQPGAVACVMLIGAFFVGVDLTWMGVDLPRRFNPGVVVGVSWALLLASGRWQSERGWVDRLGRVVGVGWIIMSIALLVETRLQ